VTTDGKRKATDEPSSPTATKRVKHHESIEPEKKPRIIPAIPFPEKVRIPRVSSCAVLYFSLSGFQY